ncbi:MAG: hypothetical protein KF796_10165 [Ramlibacter sp.]|nr:hypothetical protein [Ramlibacter sp.]
MWGWPLALGLLTTSGLLSALVSDGWGDAWSWLALGLTVAVMAWHAWQRPARARRARRARGASSSP